MIWTPPSKIGWGNMESRWPLQGSKADACEPWSSPCTDSFPEDSETWGVPELSAGLQLSSFQSADDSLCVTLRLSDGSEAVGLKRWLHDATCYMHVDHIVEIKSRTHEYLKRSVLKYHLLISFDLFWDTGIALVWFLVNHRVAEQNS